jgi:hypothetical protein
VSAPTPPKPDPSVFWQGIMQAILAPPGPHARRDAQEPRQGTEAAPGTSGAPARAETSPDGHRSASTTRAAGTEFWGPIMARIIAERGTVAAHHPPAPPPAAQRQEGEREGPARPSTGPRSCAGLSRLSTPSSSALVDRDRGPTRRRRDHAHRLRTDAA